MAQYFLEDPDEIYNFHPCDRPLKMSFYNLAELTTHQQTQFLAFKVNQLRANLKYLKEHPEITKLIELMFQAILRERPMTQRISEFLVDYLINNSLKIEQLLYKPQKKEDVQVEKEEEEVEEIREEGAIVPSEEPIQISEDKIVQSVEKEESLDTSLKDQETKSTSMFSIMVPKKKDIYFNCSYDLFCLTELKELTN